MQAEIKLACAFVLMKIRYYPLYAMLNKSVLSTSFGFHLFVSTQSVGAT